MDRAPVLWRPLQIFGVNLLSPIPHLWTFGFLIRSLLSGAKRSLSTSMPCVTFNTCRHEGVAFSILRTRHSSNLTEFQLSSSVLLPSACNVSRRRFPSLFTPFWPSEVTRAVTASLINPVMPACSRISQRRTSNKYRSFRTRWKFFVSRVQPPYSVIRKGADGVL